MTIRTNADKNGFSLPSSSSKSNSGEDDMANDAGEHGNIAEAEDNTARANDDQGESESDGSNAPAHTNQSMNGIPEFLAVAWKDSHDT
jgi:hypothetical protein